MVLVYSVKILYFSVVVFLNHFVFDCMFTEASIDLVITCILCCVNSSQIFSLLLCFLILLDAYVICLEHITRRRNTIFRFVTLYMGCVQLHTKEKWLIEGRCVRVSS
jgi:hypothetical protein